MHLKLTVLGIGSASPQVGKNPSAFLVSFNNEHVLVDCGEGTQHRLLEKSIKISRLKTICISHLHGDHYFGLIGLLSSMNLSGRTEPMTLIGPEQLLDILNIQFLAANTSLGFELNFIKTDNSKSELLLEHKAFTIETIPLIHRVPCTGFKITEKAGRRHLIPEKLPKSFPVAFINLLKDGKDVTDPLTQEVFKSLEYTKRGEPAKVFSYCSDTAYNPVIVPIIEGSDLVYHEATFTKELEDRAAKTQHSTAEQAAQIAKDAKVKKMILGHLSSRYKTTDAHLEEAEKVSSNVEMAVQGAVYQI
ncbi:ribonuclease Z [Arcticibacterium luteifluviistationis]|uniref:Ribonuclease Z n=1 Tax=Arcticibacterium luteifluviistationis TaxID=1784714 RepID=A0A2Z4GBE4_9BACT|nr:ribonuclease Z [Arcticibacterium luteifluviistationis]